MSSVSSDLSEGVVIDRDDVSNYNPEQILPESSDSIQKIREWLQPTAYNLDSGEFRKHVASHVAGTGVWLTSSTQYQEWLHGDEHGLLWIKGIPGSGKSVLAGKLTDDLSQSRPGVPVLYFFFRQIIDANHQPVSLLRDWLDQVLIYSPPLQKQLKGYVSSGRSLSSLSMEDFWKDLRMAFSGLPGQVYCIADALDEMDRGNDTFLEELAALAQWKPGKVKILITSRPVPSVESSLRTTKSLQLRLEEDLVDMDISSYVRHALEASSIAPSDQKLIKEAVPGRANGLFLYAKFAMDAFLEPGAQIETVLRLLPADLNAMYTSLLHEHARRSGVPDDIQLLILQWVTHATRPLRLLEVAEMLDVTYRAKMDRDRDLKAAKTLVRAACGPLLEILPDETICVVHHSFTEYLKGSTRLGSAAEYPVLQLGSTHARLALACLTYLQSGCLDQVVVKKRIGVESDEDLDNDSDDGYQLWRGHQQIPLKLKYPFLDYASRNWQIHTTRSTNAGHDQAEVTDAIENFLGNCQRLNAWLTLVWGNDRYSSQGVTHLHIAASTGLTDYVKRLLKSRSVDVEACDASGRTPLWWAASWGHAEIIRLLIEAGANVDMSEFVRDRKPIEVAANKNHFEAVTALLGAGAESFPLKPKDNLNKQDRHERPSIGDRALMSACHYGHVETVEVFLHFHQDIDIVHRALAWAATMGQSQVVEHIIGRPGVDVNAKVYGDTPLFLACHSDDVRTVTLLINAGADPTILCDGTDEVFDDEVVHLQGHEGKELTRGLTPLHGLCGLARRNQRRRHDPDPDNVQAIFSLLIRAGVDIHQRTPRGFTALHGAGSSPILIRLLIDAGADANDSADNGSTPLHYAVSPDSISLLVEHGQADLNKRRRLDGRTPLLYILGYHPLVNILKFLEYGPDCTATDKHGDGALHNMLQRALAGADTALVITRALLEKGANPNLKNHLGQTPLHVICKENKEMGQIIDLLLDAGADINAKYKDGATVLFSLLSTGSQWPHDPISRRSNDSFQRRFQTFLDRGASTDVRDFHGRTLLHGAVKSTTPSIPHIACVDFLLSLGLDPRATDYRGNNLLHELALRRDLENMSSDHYFVPIWEKLITLGLDVAECNNRGRTPLHIMCCNQPRRSDFHVAETTPMDLIISVTADIDIADQDGITPLHLAATTSEYHAKKLLDAGANPTTPTFEGLTPLHLAARSRQSNIVGLLLDALRSRDSGADSTSTADLKARFWSLSADIQLDEQRNDPPTGINAQDDSDWTPLSYACRSGRPETVALLLHAGADVGTGNVFQACAEFEEEQELWSKDYREADGRDSQHAGGLRLIDTSRPAVGTHFPAGQVLDPNLDSTRLEEILEMLVSHGADTARLNCQRWCTGVDRTAFYGHLGKGHRDYTIACFTRVRDRLATNVTTGSTATTSNSFAEHVSRYQQGAIAQALREFERIEPGERNPDPFYYLLTRRHYDLMGQLYRSEVDFLAMDRWSGTSNLDYLVQHGFAALLEKIGGLVAEAKFKEGTWHAAGDHTHPCLSHCTRGATETEHVCRGSAHGPLLLQAVRRELPNMDVVRLLVERFGVDVNEPLPTLIESALLFLAMGRFWWHVSLAIPYLIDHSANLEFRDYEGRTPLQVAVGGVDTRCGPFHKDAARVLVVAGADVNAFDREGRSCLSYASNDAEMIRLLTAHGAIIKADALFAAIDGKRTEVLEELLVAGADANMRLEEASETRAKGINRRRHIDDGMLFPVYHAAVSHYTIHTDSREGHNHTREAAIRLVDTLLAHGADPFARFTKRLVGHWYLGDDVFHGETNNGEADNAPPASPSRMPVTETISATPIKLKTSRPSTGYEECTVLHQLLIDSDIVHPFLNLPRIDPNQRDAKGRTVFHAACSSRLGPDNPIDALNEHERDVNRITAPTFFNHLLSLGADPQACDNAGRNALHHMLRLRDFDDNRIATRNATPAFEASLTYLVKMHPALISQRDCAGKTPLHVALVRAASTNNPMAAETLLAAGADPLVADNDGNTACHVLARRLNDANLRALFQKMLTLGLDVNARNSRGETPLFAFYEESHGLWSRTLPEHLERFLEAEKEALTMLDSMEANFHARDGRGRTLLHAAAKGHVRRFDRLVNRGLNLMLEDDGQQTALDVAAAHGNQEILGLFERKKQ